MAEKTCDIFISWSGRQAQTIAQALREFFSDVLQTGAFHSAEDIPNGEYWHQHLERKLLEATFGVIVLTPENLHEPWLFFEAGAVKLSPEKRCCPLLFGDLSLAKLPPPFQPLQGQAFEKERLRKLVKEMNGKLAADDWDNVNRRFNANWKNLKTSIDAALVVKSAPRLVPSAPQAELPPTLARLLEIWQGRRDLPANHPATAGDFKLFTFCGITDDEVDPEVKAADDREQVYYLWADTKKGSTISAAGVDQGGRRLVIRFDNKPGAHPSNVAIRPNGRSLLRSKSGFKSMSFRVRIPGERPQGADQVQLGIRIIDRTEHALDVPQARVLPLVPDQVAAGQKLENGHGGSFGSEP